MSGELIRMSGAALAVWLLGACCSPAQPDNDAFAHRLPLVGTNVVFDAYMLGATMEPGEPDHAMPNLTAQASVWWTWTAPADGVLAITPPGFDISTVAGNGLALYRGSEVTSLTRVTNWNVTAGEVCQIARFAPDYPGYEGNKLQLKFYPPPPNDYFTNSIPLEGANPHFSGWTYGATREPGETTRGAGTLWWHWRAPADGVVRFQTSRDDYFGAAMGIYQGSAVDQLRPVLPGSPSTQVVDVKAGELYYFVVAGLTERDTFSFTGQLILSPLSIVEPVSGTVYPAPTNVVVRLSSTAPETTYSWVGVYGTNGSARIESPAFVSQLVLSNLPPGQYSIRAVAGDVTHRFSYTTPEVVFRVLLPNDNFTNRTLLEGTNLTVVGDTRRATAEPGEIDTTGSVWWTWTAPQSGWCILRPSNGNMPRLQVFQGDQLDTLTSVPRCPDGPGVGTFAFPIQSGGAYHVRATGDAFAEQPTEFFRLTVAPPQLNDDFTNRLSLQGDHNRLEGRLLLATPEPGEPAPLNNLEFASVWYTWTTPVAGRLVARMIKANDWRDSVAIFSGDSLSTLQPLGQFAQVQPGQTCQIALYGNRYFSEPVAADLSFFPTPANDLFENAQVLPGSKGEVTGQNAGATGEPVVGDGQLQTVWYEWTAPFNGLLTVANSTSPFGCCGPNVVAYQGSNLTALVDVSALNFVSTPGTNDEPGWYSRQYEVLADTTYYLAVCSETALAGPFTLQYAFTPAPTNDLFANRILLQGRRCVWSGSNALATREPGEPVIGQFENGRSLWWQWTAPATGWAWLKASSTNFPPLLRAYEGPALTNLWQAPAIYGSDYSELWFRTEAGHSYSLLVDTAWADTTGGEFSAELDLTTAQVVLSEQDPDFTAPRSVSLELSQTAPEVDGQLGGVQYSVQNLSNVVGVAMLSPFRWQTPIMGPGHYRALALATNAAGEVRHCLPCDFALAPLNDRFAARQLLHGRTIQVEGTVAGASREFGEPVLYEYGDGYSVWYTWQAMADGEVVLRATGFNEVWPEWSQFLLGVYTGDTLAGLQVVPLSVSDRREFRFNASRGQTYQIAVEGFSDESFLLRLSQATISFVAPTDYAVFVENQPITFEVATTELPDQLAGIDYLGGDQLIGSVTAPPYRFVWTNAAPGGIQVTARGRLVGGETNGPVDQVYIGVAPGNDTFAMRQPVAGTNLHLLGNTSNARSLEGELSGGCAWFTWTAPWSGLLRLSPPPAQPCPYITVYTGSTAAELTTVATNVYSWYEPFPVALAVRPGTTYHIAVRSVASGGSFDVQLAFEPAPVNDDFEHRALLVGATAQLQGSIALATAEAGEPGYLYPQFYGDQPRHSLWWTWVAPERGTICLSNLTWDPDYFYFDLDYGFYTGSSLSNLVLLTTINTSLPAPMFAVEAGQTYHLAINDPNDHFDQFTAQFQFIPVPANDQFEHRQPIAGRQLSVLGSTLGATAEPGEPAHDVFDPAQHSVWYSWTAPFSGIVYWLYTSGFPIIRPAAYVGDSLTGLSRIPPVPDVAGFMAQEGTTYSIAVDSFSWPPGIFNLSLLMRRTVPPPNDLLANRIPLHEGAAPVEGWNHYASREYQEPNIAGRWGGRSAWYSWTPAVSGPAVIRIKADEYPLLLGVYEGAEVANLTPVAQLASSTLSDELRFTAQAGHEYVIAVDGENGVSSEFEIQAILPAVEQWPELVLSQTPQGQWSILVRNLAGRGVRLETSSDFQTWEPQANYAGGTDDWQWPLPSRPQDDHGPRFYRALILE